MSDKMYNAILLYEEISNNVSFEYDGICNNKCFKNCKFLDGDLLDYPCCVLFGKDLNCVKDAIIRLDVCRKLFQ